MTGIKLVKSQDFRMTEGQLEAMRAIAAKEERTLSATFREAVKLYIAHHQPN